MSQSRTEQIRQLMGRGHSQAEIARMVSCSQAHVSRTLRGKVSSAPRRVKVTTYRGVIVYHLEVVGQIVIAITSRGVFIRHASDGLATHA
jgi:predicted transcriptional regulator